jgi:DNA-binding transcriptional LysR family regulator
MINFNQLRVFYYVARYLNHTLAAQKLHISQPAVTSQLKLFEDSCGLKLFKKKGRKIYLTGEGKALYDYAHKIFEDEKEIEVAVQEIKRLKRGVLHLGCTKTYARYFMPLLISSFQEIYPGIKIHLDEGSSSDMIHSVIDLKNEVAIVSAVEDNATICFVPLGKEELALILPPRHHLAQKKAITLRELVEEPIIMKEKGSGTRKLVNELFSRDNCTPNELMETSNTELIKQLVQRGKGISFLVKEALASELKEGQLVTVPLRGEKVYVDVTIAYLKNQHLSPPAKAFVNLLKKLPDQMPLEGMRSLIERIPSHLKSGDSFASEE